MPRRSKAAATRTIAARVDAYELALLESVRQHLCAHSITLDGHPVTRDVAPDRGDAIRYCVGFTAACVALGYTSPGADLTLPPGQNPAETVSRLITHGLELRPPGRVSRRPT